MCLESLVSFPPPPFLFLLMKVYLLTHAQPPPHQWTWKQPGMGEQGGAGMGHVWDRDKTCCTDASQVIFFFFALPPKGFKHASRALLLLLFLTFFLSILPKMRLWHILGVIYIYILLYVVYTRAWDAFSSPGSFFFFFSLQPGCYDFSYFVSFTYVFSLFLEVSHGTAALTHFSLTHSTATMV